MGLYDTIYFSDNCPECKLHQTFEGQTKELSSKMYSYEAIEDDWETSFMGKKFRKDLPVFPKNESDKEHTVWKSQAERAEALATIKEKVSEISICFRCDQCDNFFDGCLPVKKGLVRNKLMWRFKR